MISSLAEPTEKWGELHDGQSISSMEGETHLWRGRLIYGEGDSSTEGETRLKRGRLIHAGKDLSFEGETLLQRGKFIPFEGTKLLICFLLYFFSPVKSCQTNNIMPSSETGCIGWETKYKDVREGTKDMYSTNS